MIVKLFATFTPYFAVESVRIGVVAPDAAEVFYGDFNRMLYMIHGIDGDNGDRIRAEVKPAHFAYLAEHKNIVVLGGATLADDSAARTGSLLVINAPNRAAADEFANNEPFFKAGLFQHRIVSRMRRGQWNPAAAPITAEGE